MLASLAVAVACATLPASLTSLIGDRDAAYTAMGGHGAGHDARGTDTGRESSEDDDLDERDDLDDLDDLLAIVSAHTRTFVALVTVPTWLVHTPRSPRAPHPEDTLRPPIAC